MSVGSYIVFLENCVFIYIVHLSVALLILFHGFYVSFQILGAC